MKYHQILLLSGALKSVLYSMLFLYIVILFRFFLKNVFFPIRAGLIVDYLCQIWDCAYKS